MRALRDAGAAIVVWHPRRQLELPGWADAARGVSAQARLRARRRSRRPSEVVERSGRFTVQRHRATALHYDFRLEIDGVLVSWAVPKGPTLDPKVRRLAMRTEDHPIEYLHFEGVIPAKEYGGGDVIVWDWGTFEPEPETPDPATALRKGEIKFILHGERLHGRYTIIRTDSDDGRERWLLLKKKDEAAVDGWDAEDHPASVKTGRTNDEVRDGVAPRFTAEPPRAARRDRPVGVASQAPMPDFIPPMKATLATEPVQRPGLAVRGEVGRLPGRGGGAGRTRADSGPGVARTPDVYFPDARSGDGPGSRPTRRSWTARWWRSTSRAGLGSACSRTETGIRTGRAPGGKRRASRRRSCTRRSTCSTSTDARSWACPLEERKRLLHGRLRPHPLVRYAGHVEADGIAFFEAARQQELEGDRREASALAVRAGSAQQVVAQAEGPPRAGGRRRRLAAGPGERTPTSAR